MLRISHLGLKMLCVQANTMKTYDSLSLDLLFGSCFTLTLFSKTGFVWQQHNSNKRIFSLFLQILNYLSAYSYYNSTFHIQTLSQQKTWTSLPAVRQGWRKIQKPGERLYSEGHASLPCWIGTLTCFVADLNFTFQRQIFLSVNLSTVEGWQRLCYCCPLSCSSLRAHHSTVLSPHTKKKHWALHKEMVK